MHLDSPRLYFTLKKKIIKLASDMDCGVKFNQEKKCINLFSHEYPNERSDTTMRQIDLQKKRLEKIFELKSIIQEQFEFKKTKDSSFLNHLDKDMQDIRKFRMIRYVWDLWRVHRGQIQVVLRSYLLLNLY